MSGNLCRCGAYDHIVAAIQDAARVPGPCEEVESASFALERPRDLAAALALRAQAGRNDAPAEYIAGGTDMMQLLQEYVRRPERLVSLAASWMRASTLDRRASGSALPPPWRRSPPTRA